MRFASWIAAGAIAGWLTGKMLKRYGYSPLMDIVMGITGAVAVGFTISAMGAPGQAGILATTLVAIQGAILLTLLVALASGKKRHAWASEAVPLWRHSKRKGEPALSQSRETD